MSYDHVFSPGEYVRIITKEEYDQIHTEPYRDTCVLADYQGVVCKIKKVLNFGEYLLENTNNVESRFGHKRLETYTWPGCFIVQAEPEPLQDNEFLNILFDNGGESHAKRLWLP